MLFNSTFAALSSSILLPKRETDTGEPPKFPPEPYIKLSTPITGPTSSSSLLVTISEEISSGLSSPGKRLIFNCAVDEPGPKRLITFSKSILLVPFRYFSVNS